MYVSKLRFLAAAICLLALSNIEAYGQSVITITLRDKSSLFHGAVMAVPRKVSHGKITLKVTNESEHFRHAIAVVPMSVDRTELSMRDSKSGDYDYTYHSIGLVEDIAPRATNMITLDLEHGTYMVTSNLRGPHLNGMWTTFVVE
jgi:hypothetical protein